MLKFLEMQVQARPCWHWRRGGGIGQWQENGCRTQRGNWIFKSSIGKTMSMAIIRLVGLRMQKGVCELTGTKSAHEHKMLKTEKLTF
jgi:hypothetical protein